jgi:hypothetical protein
MLPASKWREGRIGLLPEVVECYRRLECPADLTAIGGGGGVVAHILWLERADGQATIGEEVYARACLLLWVIAGSVAWLA